MNNTHKIIAAGVVGLVLGSFGTWGVGVLRHDGDYVRGYDKREFSGRGMGMHQMPDGSMMGGMDHNMGSMMMDMTAGMKGKTGKDLEKVFLEEMIVHHQGAVDMAKLLLEDKTINPELAKFANDIITLQTKEIEMQKNWLSTWFNK